MIRRQKEIEMGNVAESRGGGIAVCHQIRHPLTLPRLPSLALVPLLQV